MPKKKWNKFLKGHWTKKVPSKKGLYALARKNGFQAGYGYLHHIHEYDMATWDEWFWSEPVPSLPAPPPWEEDNNAK